MSSHDTACPLATLASHSGVVHFYSEVALRIWVEMEQVLAAKLKDSLPAATSSELRSSAWYNSASVMASPTLLEGFSIEQWACYAKKKSSVATAMCRLNGQLKEKLAKLAKGDPLGLADPWLNAKPTWTRDKLDDDGQNAWEGWQPIQDQDDKSPNTIKSNSEQHDSNDAVRGDWRSLPPDAWDSIYAHFHTPNRGKDKISADDERGTESETGCEDHHNDSESNIFTEHRKTTPAKSKDADLEFKEDFHRSIAQTNATIEQIQQSSIELNAKIAQIEQRMTGD